MNVLMVIGKILIVGAVVIGTAVVWEIVAWWTHRYVMHGVGWFLHKDHHRTTGRRLQFNDAYALFFALCSFLLIYKGLKSSIVLITASGFGVALYGVCYVLFHEVVFHRRIRWIRLRPKGSYLRRIIDNHRIHHGTVTKDGASNFGFLWAPAPEKDLSGDIPE